MHDILIQLQWNYMEMKNLHYMLDIDILRNSSHKRIRCPEGWVWVSKKTPDFLLAKTMC